MCVYIYVREFGEMVKKRKTEVVVTKIINAPGQFFPSFVLPDTAGHSLPQNIC